MDALTTWASRDSLPKTTASSAMAASPASSIDRAKSLAVFRRDVESQAAEEEVEEEEGKHASAHVADEDGVYVSAAASSDCTSALSSCVGEVAPERAVAGAAATVAFVRMSGCKSGDRCKRGCVR